MFDSIERSFDSEKEKRVVQMYESGRYVTAIQNEVNVSPSKMYSILKKYGIKKRNDVSKKDYVVEESDETIQKIKDMYSDEDYTIKNILDETGISQHVFYKIVNELGLTKRKPRNTQSEKYLEKFDKKDIEFIKDNYPNGSFTVSEMIDKCDSVTYRQLYNIIDYLGLEKRQNPTRNDWEYINQFPEYIIDIIKEMYQDEDNKVQDIIDTLDDINKQQFYRIINILGLEHRRSDGGDKEKTSSQVGGVELNNNVEDKEPEIKSVSQDVKSISIKNGTMKFKKGDIEMDITGDIEIKFN